MTEILILDYNRHNELRTLLESIKKNALFDKKVVVLNNGGNKYGAWDDLRKEGLLDVVIHNNVNVGCGAGTIQLFARCKSEYAFYIQVDHELALPIRQEDIDSFKSVIEDEENNFCYIDLAGDQGGGKYSERAQFMHVGYYNSIPKSIGGPGPWEHLKWTEECVQDEMDARGIGGYTVLAKVSDGTQQYSIPPFLDKGKFSVRSNPDGSEWTHRTDTKVVWCNKAPKEVYSYPPLSNEQWQKAIAGEWPKEGEVPEGWKDNVFNCWGD